MNKEKVREALELCYAWLESVYPEKFFPHPAIGRLGRSTQARAARQAAKEALAELDKAPVVMTDERPWMNEWQRNMCKKSKGVLVRMIEEEREENDRLRNEAPAAGLTVEEVMDIMDEWTGDRPESFRARLTAAINAKQAKP